jgi:hypothetical protein
VEKACAKGNARDTKDALLAWAAVRWPDHSITSLVDIADAGSAELSTQIHALNSALYSAHHDQWDPAALRRAFQGFIASRHKTEKAPKSVLEPLYKT